MVVSKCANPSCSVVFHHLGAGRLFRFEVRLPCGSCRDVPETVCRTKTGRASVFFWLCSECALDYTLSFDVVHGVNVKPVLPNRDSASAALHPGLEGMSKQVRDFPSTPVEVMCRTRKIHCE
jgi:hypothetical protein